MTWSFRPVPVRSRPFTVDELLEQNLAEGPARTALVLGDRELTYEELGHDVSRVASWLRSVGLGRGDRVAIHLPKSFEEVSATFAAARLGCVFVNINYQLHPRQVEHIRSDCGARALVTDSRRAVQLAEHGILGRFESLLLKDGPMTREGAEVGSSTEVISWSDLPRSEGVDAPRPVDRDLAALLYTSGSTGRPKGVMVTHENLVQGARIVARYLEAGPSDRVLGLLPMSFDYGLNQVTSSFLVGGGVVLQAVGMPAEIVRTVRSHEVTGVAGVPMLWIRMDEYLQAAAPEDRAMPSLRYVTNSGGKIPDPVLRRMPDLYSDAKIFLMYGLTEGFRSTFLPPELFEEKRGAIGWAVPNVEIYVVDPETGVCGPGESGELLHRGSLVSRGYWGDPERTNHRIRVNEHLRDLIGDEAVLHSGDQVRIDQDGCLWFVGRMDGMIKSAGFRISPNEVEEVLYESDLVAEAVAFGVDDDVRGQAVNVAVSWRPSGAGREAELLAFCRDRMPGYMQPTRVWVWDGAMPLTSSGKVDRTEVVRALSRMSAGGEPGRVGSSVEGSQR